MDSCTNSRDHPCDDGFGVRFLLIHCPTSITVYGVHLGWSRFVSLTLMLQESPSLFGWCWKIMTMTMMKKTMFVIGLVLVTVMMLVAKVTMWWEYVVHLRNMLRYEYSRYISIYHIWICDYLCIVAPSQDYIYILMYIQMICTYSFNPVFAFQMSRYHIWNSMKSHSSRWFWIAKF